MPTDEPDDVKNAALDRGALQRLAIQGSFWTAIHSVVSIPVAFVVNIVIARVLGVVDYGRLAFLSSAIGIVSGFVEVGIGTGLVQFGSKWHAMGRTEDVVDLLRKTQGFRLVVVAPVLTVVVVLLSDIDPLMRLAAVLFGVLLPAATAGGLACLAIENRTAVTAQLAMGANIVTQVVVLGVVLLFHSADSIWVARLILSGLGIAFALFFVNRVYRLAVVRPLWPRRFPEGFWRFAAPAGIALLLADLVVSRTEVLFLTWLSQPAAAGIFALAFSLAGHLFAPAQSIVGPLVPAVSALREVDEAATGRSFTRVLRSVATLSALLVASPLVAFACLVPLIYGDEYRAAQDPMMALGVAGGLLMASGPVQAFVQARLLGARILRISVVALTVDVAVALSLIPVVGVWGAVAANIAGAATQMLLLLKSEVAALHVGWRSTGKALLPMLVGTLAALMVWSIRGLWHLPVGVEAAAAGLGGLLLVLAGLRFTRTGLTRDDSSAIVTAIPSRARPTVSLLLRLCTVAT